MKFLQSTIRPFWGLFLFFCLSGVLQTSCTPKWRNSSNAVAKVDTIQKAAALKELMAFVQTSNLNFNKSQLQQLLDLLENNVGFSKRMLLSTKEVVDSTNIIAIAQQLKLSKNPTNASLTLYQTRVWYAWQKSLIGKEVDRSKGLEQAAINAYKRRNAIRTKARLLMKDTDIADFLNQKEVNMTWKQVFMKNKGDYEAIISSSMRGRTVVDLLFKIPK
jgi:mannose/fructose/N-acetylgalactosamine-specific phosphotransferase system component IIB